MMPQLDMVTSTDTKGVLMITGFCRQRLNVVRKDPELGFPEPSQIGRSLRWFVHEVVQWMQTKKRSSAAQLDLASRKVPVGLKSTKTTRPPNPWPWALVAKTERPTLAEVQAANEQACAIRLQPGQVRIGRPIVTREGTSVMRYSVSGAPREGVTPPLTIRCKVTFGAGVQAQAKVRYLSGPAVGASADELLDKAPGKKPRPKEGKGDSALHELSASLEVSLAELKNRYESGLSLDALCAQYRMGKSRLSKLLREAGVQMRPAGRKPRLSG